MTIVNLGVSHGSATAGVLGKLAVPSTNAAVSWPGCKILRQLFDLIAESPAAGFLVKPELSAQAISRILDHTP
jgi:hypothetical protein